MATRSEFAASIKAKYPAYKDVDDSVLVEKMLAKYPQYADRVTDDPAPAEPAQPTPEAPAAEMGWLDKMSRLQPSLKPLAIGAQKGLQFAGNVATALSTGPVNAVAQGIQDGAGVGGTIANVARAVADPFIPGKSPIQSTGTTLERAGVPNTPYQFEYKVPVVLVRMKPEAYGFTPEQAKALPDDEPVTMTATRPGRARDLGSGADMASPLYGVAAIKAMGSMARAALRSGVGKVAGKAAGATNKLAGNLAAATTDIPEEALRMASTPEGRKALEAMYGKEFEVGGRFLDKIDNFKEESIPELQLIDEALATKGQPISTESMARAGEAAIPRGIPGLGVDPAAARVASRVEPWVDYVRGGPLPEDLAQTATEAGKKAAGASSEAATLGTVAAKDAKLATQAERAQAFAQSKAGRAAAGVGQAKKDAKEAFYSWDRRDAKAAIPKAIQDARDAAAKAKETAIDARAKVAIGEVSQAEADAAQRIAENSQRTAEVAEAAMRIHGGEKIDAVAKDFSSRGLGKDALREIIQRSKAKVASTPKGEPVILSAVDYRKLRTKLDRQIPFDDEDFNAMRDVFMAMRTKGKEELSAMAKRSGIEGYDTWMAEVTRKMGRLEDFKALAGSSKDARGRRIESLIKNAMGGSNPEYKKQLFADMDEIMGTGFSSDIKTMALSRKLGPEGKAPWLPPQHNGSFMKSLAYLKAVGATAIGSPWVATHATLPFLNYLETSLKAGKIPVSPKAAAALSALKKPINETQKVRLINILAAELEAQAPANAIPFKKVAEEDDDTSTISMRSK